MNENYCPSCYRSLPADRPVCSSCEGHRALQGTHVRLPLLLGAAAGVPLFVFGMLYRDVRACLAGAILCGGAALAHVMMALWSAGREPR